MSRAPLPCTPAALESLPSTVFERVEPRWVRGVRGAVKLPRFVEVKR